MTRARIEFECNSSTPFRIDNFRIIFELKTNKQRRAGLIALEKLRETAQEIYIRWGSHAIGEI